jgi:tRNA threonylcarbamoyladenosine biosynthesis protein TsaB
MNILALDTSGAAAGVAVTRDGSIAYEAVSSNGFARHSQIIIPMAEQALSACSLKARDIDLFAAVAGPGSFTGVRIGVCAIKALAMSVKRPVIGLDALMLLAMGAPHFDGTICPILDARRGNVYCAAFTGSDPLPVRLMDDALMPINELLDRLPADRRLLFTGDGLSVYARYIMERLDGRAFIAQPYLAYVRPAVACHAAYALKHEAVEPGELVPVYLQKPQAERERAAMLNILCPS